LRSALAGTLEVEPKSGNGRRSTVSARQALARHRRLGAAVVAAGALGAGTAVGVTHALGSSSSGAAAAVTVPAAPAQPAALGSGALDPAQIYSQSAGGVVDIDVSGSVNDNYSPFGGQQQTEGEGSGFVIDTKGDIVTNAHVASGASSIVVHFKDGTRAKATLVGSDPSTDIAVVRVNVSSSKLHPLDLGTSGGIVPGESVVAIGSPFGLPGTITSGIVSATGRTITSPNGSPIAGAIQTDAAINKGNSGGPLIDARGNVVGVNAQIDSDSGGSDGVGFAIPIDTAKQIAGQLIASGKVQHAFLGVRVADATPGARISSVVAGSSAAKAGLKTGDVVVSVDGKTVANADRLQALIASHKPGDTVTLRVSRSGGQHTLTAKLGTRSG
jgi:putative serine protease PepD